MVPRYALPVPSHRRGSGSIFVLAQRTLFAAGARFVENRSRFAVNWSEITVNWLRFTMNGDEIAVNAADS